MFSARHLTSAYVFFFIHKQIDKLLKLANATERATATKDEDDDPLRFGPNPGALVSKTGEDEEGGDGMYRPPKMLPTSMDFESGGKDAKELRRNKEQRRRAGRSQLIKVRTCLRARVCVFVCLLACRIREKRQFAPRVSFHETVRGFLIYLADIKCTKSWAGCHLFSSG